MTTGDMLALVTENLKLAGVTPPQNDRVVRVLNKQKDALQAELEQLNQARFVERQDYTVTTATTYLSMPTGWLRVLGLHLVDGTCERPVSVVGSLQEVGPTRCDLTLYLEGGKLWFVGTPPACTLRLRYRKRLSDMSTATLSAEYADLPPEWHRVLPDMASAALIPADNPERGKYLQEIAAALSQARASLNLLVDAGPWSILDNLNLGC